MPDFTTMAATATATGTTTANMPATTARGCRPRHRRGTGNGLHTLLASIAIISCFLRILYADESPVRFRPAGGCGAFSRRSSGTGTIHRMLSLLRELPHGKVCFRHIPGRLGWLRLRRDDSLIARHPYAPCPAGVMIHATSWPDANSRGPRK